MNKTPEITYNKLIKEYSEPETWDYFGPDIPHQDLIKLCVFKLFEKPSHEWIERVVDDITGKYLMEYFIAKGTEAESDAFKNLQDVLLEQLTAEIGEELDADLNEEHDCAVYSEAQDNGWSEEEEHFWMDSNHC